MENTDTQLAKRIRDIIAVATDDFDAVNFAVEDRVAYIEGVVPSKEQQHSIIHAVRNLDGLDQVVVCLATEHVLPQRANNSNLVQVPPTVLMHYHSLS
jgi:osmotically-inducible protein OsmY